MNRYEVEEEAIGIQPLEYRPEWTLLKTYPARGDGRQARVFVSCMPARFYRIEFDEVVLTTGSSCSELAHDIAEAVSEGMLGVAES
jgi:hypothetical protein